MLPNSLKKLIDSLAKLPGVGTKTAQRFAYFLLRSHRSLSKEIGENLLHLQEKISLCNECHTIIDIESNNTLCQICLNPRRDRQTICVVEQVFDAEAIEHSGEYRGVYHVLHGRISPLDNVAPEDLKIKELVQRIKKLKEENPEALLEIILAMNPSNEGETTAFYMQKLLKPMNVKITRIATGIPVGAELEYADEVTLGRAIKGRQNYE